MNIQHKKSHFGASHLTFPSFTCHAFKMEIVFNITIKCFWTSNSEERVNHVS